MSSPSILKGDVSCQPFAAMLPTVVPSALQMAVRREGRGGRTANEIEQLKQTSMNEGFDEGYARGLDLGISEGSDRAYAEAYAKADAEASEKTAQMLAEFSVDLDRVVASVLKAVEDWTSESEQKLTDFAITIAERVLESELKSSRESILSIVRSAVQEVTHSDSARIRLNPWDSALVSEHRGAIIASSQSIRSFEIVEDDSIGGGCVIETSGGIVDATLAGKLERLDGELGEAA